MQYISALFVCCSIAAVLSCVTCSTCGYDNCPAAEDGLINVHLVPHTHDDMGWLKTVDQYYYGANTSIAFGGVQYIISSVIDNLLANPNRRFTYVEMGFFTRWWQNQHDIIRHRVKGLVTSGQLHFANGGWTANDEANSHYAAIIDQMTLGLSFLNSSFGACGAPKVGWSIDAFGHSKEMASLYALMGMDAYFFARIHYNDRTKRKKDKEMEYLWHADKNLGPASDLFTGTFYNHYDPPATFSFDEFSNDQPIMDDDRMEDYNADEEQFNCATDPGTLSSTKDVKEDEHRCRNFVNELAFDRRHVQKSDVLAGPAADLFTGTFYDFYGPPAGFCFDEFCNDQPIMDDDRMEDYNADERANAFVAAAHQYASAYKSNHILMTMGSDFNYMNAQRWFINLERLMTHVNEGQKAGKHNVTAYYSQPACYLKSLHHANLTWPTKTDDFFPYATDEHSYWTGYFTSRPTFKGYIRKVNAMLQMCRQIDANYGLGPSDLGNLNVVGKKIYGKIGGSEVHQPP